MRRLLVVIPVAMFAWALLTSEPYRQGRVRPADGSAETAVSPAQQGAPVLSASALSDTLPARLIEEMGLGGIEGVSLTFANGSRSSYFAYEADAKTLLRELALVPFDRSYPVADCKATAIGAGVLFALRSRLTQSELETGADFWSADLSEFSAYQCLKPPFLHVILVSNGGKMILHRVTTV